MLRYFRIVAAVLGFIVLYIALLYATSREQFLQVYLLFTGLFAIYFSLTYTYILPSLRQSESKNALYGSTLEYIPLIIVLGVLFRIIAIGSLPELSDDYFRFIWDGRLLARGVNPFTRLPSEYMEDPLLAQSLGLDQSLYESLNSPEYYTIYPPLNQFIFWLTAYLSPRNAQMQVLGMKIILLLAETGTLLLLPRLLSKLSLPQAWLTLYALNPLVIVELCGNLHFEALLIFFLLLSLYGLVSSNWLMASIAFGFSIASKLIPVIFLPLLIRRMGFWQTILFSSIALVLNLILFVPLMDQETFLNMGDSIGLYFQSFEFNASIYYLIRWVGYQIRGYNVIAIVGKYLALAVFLGVWLIALLERSPNWKNLPRSMIFVLTLYFTLASIVHPWYITTLLVLSCLTTYRFPIIWTLTILLSYFTYRNTFYEENLWLTVIEYFAVFGWMIYEWNFRTTQS